VTSEDHHAVNDDFDDASPDNIAALLAKAEDLLEAECPRIDAVAQVLRLRKPLGEGVPVASGSLRRTSAPTLVSAKSQTDRSNSGTLARGRHPNWKHVSLNIPVAMRHQKAPSRVNPHSPYTRPTNARIILGSSGANNSTGAAGSRRNEREFRGSDTGCHS
jgi:hypothetical protein